MPLDDEASVPGDLPHQALQVLVARELDCPAAIPADDMMAVGEPRGGIAMAATLAMDPTYEAEALQECKGAVNGHDAHAGMPAEGARVDFLRQQCPMGMSQSPGNGQARPGPTQPLRPQSALNFGDERGVHLLKYPFTYPRLPLHRRRVKAGSAEPAAGVWWGVPGRIARITGGATVRLRGFVIMVVALLLMLVAAIGVGLFETPYTFRGSLLEPASPAPDFLLTDQHGQPFRLSDQEGNVVAIFFGYTSCPDVCPATLALFKQVRESLGPASGQTRFVFITIDPDRDTSEHILEHLNRIDPEIIGLTGPEEELQPVWAAYGVYRAEQPSQGAAGALFDHSARVYVVDRGGSLRVSYTFGTTVDEIADDLRFLIGED
jgi:protein SCO1/2